MLHAQSGTILIAHGWVFPPQSQVKVGLSPYTTDHVQISYDTNLYFMTTILGYKVQMSYCKFLKSRLLSNY